MKTKKELIKEKEKIEKQILELETKEEEEDYNEVKHKGKTFRIYKWENKPFKDLLSNLPKGFRLAEFQEFNKLIESGFELEVWKEYITKHFNKLQENKEYCLSRVCLDSYGGLCCDDDILAGSDDDGRVVLVEGDGE